MTFLRFMILHAIIIISLMLNGLPEIERDEDIIRSLAIHMAVCIEECKDRGLPFTDGEMEDVIELFHSLKEGLRLKYKVADDAFEDILFSAAGLPSTYKEKHQYKESEVQEEPPCTELTELGFRHIFEMWMKKKAPINDNVKDKDGDSSRGSSEIGGIYTCIPDCWNTKKVHTFLETIKCKHRERIPGQVEKTLIRIADIVLYSALAAILAFLYFELRRTEKSENLKRMKEAFSNKNWLTFSKEYNTWMNLQQYEHIQECWENEDIQQDYLLNEFVTEILEDVNKKYVKRLYIGYNHLTKKTVIVVVSDTEREIPTRVFQGLPIAYKHWRFRSSSSEMRNIRMNAKDTLLAREDNLKLSKIIRDHVDNLMRYHSNLEIISVSPYRSTKNGTEFIKESCIVLYCSHKGVVPLGEPWFPSELEGIGIDVREGFFYSYMLAREQNMIYPYNVHSTARLNRLRMGCNIGLLGVKKSGTLGGFVDLENNSIGFITCGHVVYDDHEGSIKAVSQPGCGTDGIPVEENVCGTVVKCTINNSTEISVDAALIELNKRLPDNIGNFAGMLYEQIKNSGFNEPPTFNTGEIRTDLNSNCFFDYPCFKCGSATGFKDGKLFLDGAAVRCTNYYQDDKKYFLKNQYEIKHVGINHFADNGDSGAFVFQYKSPEDRNTLVCIGMVIGGTEAGSVIVTPIKDVLSGLGLGENSLHVFVESEEHEPMEH